MNSTDASVSTWSIRTGAVIVYDEGLVVRPRMVGTCREVLRVVLGEKGVKSGSVGDQH